MPDTARVEMTCADAGYRQRQKTALPPLAHLSVLRALLRGYPTRAATSLLTPVAGRLQGKASDGAQYRDASRPALAARPWCAGVLPTRGPFAV